MAVRALFVMLGFGAAVGLALFVLAPWLAYDVLHTPPYLKAEVSSSIRRLNGSLHHLHRSPQRPASGLPAFRRDQCNRHAVVRPELRRAASCCFRCTDAPGSCSLSALIRVLGWRDSLLLPPQYTDSQLHSRAEEQRGSGASARLRRLGQRGRLRRPNAGLSGPVSSRALGHHDRGRVLHDSVRDCDPVIGPSRPPQLRYSSQRLPRLSMPTPNASKCSWTVASGPFASQCFPLHSWPFRSPDLPWIFWLGAQFATNSYVVLQVIALGVFINAPRSSLTRSSQQLEDPDESLSCTSPS